MFRNKSGFTLVELLGVISLLAIIVLLAIPAITGNINEGKQKLYKVQVENFEQAAKDWMSLHLLEIPDGTIDTTITLGCLKVEGLLETELENPITGEQFANDMVVKIKSGSNQYIYTFDENSGTDENALIPNQKCSFNSEAITD